MLDLPYFSKLVLKAANSIWAQIVFEEDFWYTWKIIFDNWEISFFKTTSFDINNLWASEIAKDKHYAKYFLKKSWYNIPAWDVFFSDKINNRIKNKKTIFDWLEYAKKLWFPVIIKPNNLMQWEGVAKIYYEKDYNLFADEILKTSDSFVIEEFISWNDFRILVLWDEILQAYKREHLWIIWDWIHTINELISIKQKYIFDSWRKDKIDLSDLRIKLNLEKNNFKLNTILEKDFYLRLLDCANLCSGWDGIDLTKQIHDDYKKLAINITHDMWLTFCWVDIITDDITTPISYYKVLEINSAPWLNTYGVKDEEIEEIYRKILLKLNK